MLQEPEFLSKVSGVCEQHVWEDINYSIITHFDNRYWVKHVVITYINVYCVQFTIWFAFSYTRQQLCALIPQCKLNFHVNAPPNVVNTHNVY